jgi:ribonucleoside-diphosphate reductase alpha chain
MARITKIKKRDGSLVEFSPEKIVRAVERAFIEVRQSVNSEKVKELTQNVLNELDSIFTDRHPGVENVQDFVEKQLMQQGFFDVAKAYILYRYEHAKIREVKKRELLEKIEKNEINVTKRNGAHEQFSMDKLRRSLAFAVRGLEKSVDSEVILSQCRSELYEGISTNDITKALIMTSRAMIEQDPNYATVASRLLLYTNHKHT